MTDIPKNHAEVYGKRRSDGGITLNRTKPFDGKCEFCSQEGTNADSSGLRPYGAAGEWICLACARKDPETTERRMGQVIFGEGLS